MLTVLAVGFLPIASCTENIDFSSEFEDKVTVNLILENKETQELTLATTRNPVISVTRRSPTLTCGCLTEKRKSAGSLTSAG